MNQRLLLPKTAITAREKKLRRMKSMLLDMKSNRANEFHQNAITTV
jgi:hypothetical protein